jgi:hypothetical protein
LIAKEQAIRDNTYGSIVWKNCNLKTFKQGVSTWEESERVKKKNIESFQKLIKDELTADKENTSEATVMIDVDRTCQKSKKNKKIKKKKRNEDCVHD